VGASFGEWAEARGAIAIAVDHVTVDAQNLPASPDLPAASSLPFSA